MKVSSEIKKINRGNREKGELQNLRTNMVNVYNVYLYINIQMNTLPYKKRVNKRTFINWRKPKAISPVTTRHFLYSSRMSNY